MNREPVTYTGPQFDASEFRLWLTRRREIWRNGTAAGWVSWNVTLDREASSVLQSLDEGTPFSEAMEYFADRDFTEHVGGRLEAKRPDSRTTVHSIDVTAAMRKSVLEEGQPLFYTPPKTGSLFGEQAGAEAKAAQSYKDRLLGERLTAQIKSGLPARPSNLKPAETRGLFDGPESEQGNLFQPSRVPRLSDAARSEDYVYQAPLGFHARRAEIQPIPLDGRHANIADAFVVNMDAMELIGRAAGRPADTFAPYHVGVHISARDATKLARNLRALLVQFGEKWGEKGFDAVSELTKAFVSAASTGKSAVFIADAPQWEKYHDDALNEELAHAVQARLRGTTAEHLGAGLEAFTSHPTYRTASDSLAERYPGLAAGSNREAVEVAVRLMRRDGYKELGVTPKQARLLAAHYVRILRSEYGSQNAREVAHEVFTAFEGSRSGTEPSALAERAELPGRAWTSEEPGPDLSEYRPPTRRTSGQGRDKVAGPEGPHEVAAQPRVARNPHEDRARLAKSVAVARVLDAAGVTPEEIDNLTDEQWKMAAAVGAVHAPNSKETRDEVAEQIRQIQEIRARMQHPERGAVPLGDLDAYLKDKFGANKPKVTYSGLGAVSRIVRPGQQLAEVKKASRPVFEAAIRTAGATPYVTTLIRSSIPAIKRALEGSPHNWDELKLYYVESRLRGLRDRWNNFADQAEAMSDEDLQRSLEGGEDGSAHLELLSKIEGRQGLAQDLGQTAMALAEAKDWGTLRKFIAQSYRDAAYRVARMMPDEAFSYYHGEVQNEPHMKRADELYGKLLEKPMAESHALNEGVFSDALGPANRYFPLIPFDRQQVSPEGRRLPYRKPRNQNNAFATGLSESYDISPDAFGNRLSAAVRGNNKAALIQTLLDEKWAVPESKALQDEDGKLIMRGPDGKEYEAVREESSPGRTLIQGNKLTRIPARFIVMPKFINRALAPTLAREAMDPNEVTALARWANMLATKGPLEFVFHTNGVMGALYANTPFLGDSALAKVLSAPVAKWFDIRRRMYGGLVAGKLGFQDPLDPTSPENVQKLLQMAKAGAVPSRYGKVTYSPKIAEETGAERQRFSFSPMLYGPKGLDARARVLMYDIWKAAYPDGDLISLHDFVNQLGNYIPELQGEIERWLKKVGLGPFATAGMTRLVNSIHTYTGTGPGPGGTWKSKLHWWLTASAYAALAVWVIAYKELTGKWPLRDTLARLWEFPVATGRGVLGKFRHSTLGNARWGKGNSVGYINFSFLDNPLAMRGARALGIRGAAETANLSGSSGQAAEAAQVDVMNALASPAYGPFARAAFVGATGDEPYLSGLRDYRTGRVGMQFMPGIPQKAKPGLESTGWRALAAAKQLNPFYTELGENLGSMTGFYTPDQELPKGAGQWWLRMALDIAAPGLFANAGNPYARRTNLRMQQRALGIR